MLGAIKQQFVNRFVLLFYFLRSDHVVPFLKKLNPITFFKDRPVPTTFSPSIIGYRVKLNNFISVLSRVCLLISTVSLLLLICLNIFHANIEIALLHRGNFNILDSYLALYVENSINGSSFYTPKSFWYNGAKKSHMYLPTYCGNNHYINGMPLEFRRVVRSFYPELEAHFDYFFMLFHNDLLLKGSFSDSITKEFKALDLLYGSGVDLSIEKPYIYQFKTMKNLLSLNYFFITSPELSQAFDFCFSHYYEKSAYSSYNSFLFNPLDWVLSSKNKVVLDAKIAYIYRNFYTDKSPYFFDFDFPVKNYLLSLISSKKEEEVFELNVNKEAVLKVWVLLGLDDADHPTFTEIFDSSNAISFLISKFLWSYLYAFIKFLFICFGILFNIVGWTQVCFYEFYTSTFLFIYDFIYFLLFDNGFFFIIKNFLGITIYLTHELCLLLTFIGNSVVNSVILLDAFLVKSYHFIVDTCYDLKWMLFKFISQLLFDLHFLYPDGIKPIYHMWSEYIYGPGNNLNEKCTKYWSLKRQLEKPEDIKLVVDTDNPFLERIRFINRVCNFIHTEEAIQRALEELLEELLKSELELFDPNLNPEHVVLSNLDKTNSLHAKSKQSAIECLPYFTKEDYHNFIPAWDPVFNNWSDKASSMVKDSSTVILTRERVVGQENKYNLGVFFQKLFDLKCCDMHITKHFSNISFKKALITDVLSFFKLNFSFKGLLSSLNYCLLSLVFFGIFYHILLSYFGFFNYIKFGIEDLMSYEKFLLFLGAISFIISPLFVSILFFTF